MDIEKFSDLLLVRNYQEVENVLKSGFDPNTPLQQDKPAIEWCSYSNDYRMMQILWSHGAKPTTPMTEEIINKFEIGENYIDVEKFYSAGKDEVDNLNNFIDLTEDFSVEKFEFQSGSIWKQEDNFYNINIPISKFIMDDEIVETAIRLDFISLTDLLASYIGKTVNFPVNPEEGYIDGSIYLRNCHNPVDVTQLKFLSLENEKLIVEISMKFDFEYENIGLENEEMIKTVRLQIS